MILTILYPIKVTKAVSVLLDIIQNLSNTSFNKWAHLIPAIKKGFNIPNKRISRNQLLHRMFLIFLQDTFQKKFHC